MPPPLPRSSTISPAFSSARAVGLPQPERRADRVGRHAADLVGVVEIGGHGIAAAAAALVGRWRRAARRGPRAGQHAARRLAVLLPHDGGHIGGVHVGRRLVRRLGRHRRLLVHLLVSSNYQGSKKAGRTPGHSMASLVAGIATGRVGRRIAGRPAHAHARHEPLLGRRRQPADHLDDAVADGGIEVLQHLVLLRDQVARDPRVELPAGLGDLDGRRPRVGGVGRSATGSPSAPASRPRGWWCSCRGASARPARRAAAGRARPPPRARSTASPRCRGSRCGRGRGTDRRGPGPRRRRGGPRRPARGRRRGPRVSLSVATMPGAGAACQAGPDHSTRRCRSTGHRLAARPGC